MSFQRFAYRFSTSLFALAILFWGISLVTENDFPDTYMLMCWFAGTAWWIFAKCFINQEDYEKEEEL